MQQLRPSNAYPFRFLVGGVIVRFKGNAAARLETVGMDLGVVAGWLPAHVGEQPPRRPNQRWMDPRPLVYLELRPDVRLGCSKNARGDIGVHTVKGPVPDCGPALIRGQWGRPRGDRWSVYGDRLA